MCVLRLTDGWSPCMEEEEEEEDIQLPYIPPKLIVITHVHIQYIIRLWYVLYCASPPVLQSILLLLLLLLLFLSAGMWCTVLSCAVLYCFVMWCGVMWCDVLVRACLADCGGRRELLSVCLAASMPSACGKESTLQLPRPRPRRCHLHVIAASGPPQSRMWRRVFSCRASSCMDALFCCSSEHLTSGGSFKLHNVQQEWRHTRTHNLLTMIADLSCCHHGLIHDSSYFFFAHNPWPTLPLHSFRRPFPCTHLVSTRTPIRCTSVPSCHQPTPRVELSIWPA